MSDLQENQNWYVRLPHSSSIRTMRIVQLDGNIIHLEPIRKACGFWQAEMLGGGVELLEINDVEFIQMIEQPTPTQE